MIYRVLHDLSFPKIGVQEKDVRMTLLERV